MVRPGETVPADGVVVQGVSAVEESLLTGESNPNTKRIGSPLVGGSINLTQPLTMRVERCGPDTVLAAIHRLVEQAIADKQPIVELANRYAHWFVVAVLVAACLIAGAWLIIDPARALWITVAVLVVTCPCALSLATPVTLTVATGELARYGLVVTRGRAIETLARATDVVLDKTGTLTRGELGVKKVRVLSDRSLEECVMIARALEQSSEHPIARAICRYATPIDAVPMSATVVKNYPGHGVEGIVRGVCARIGTRAFCEEVAEPMISEAELPADGTAVYLAHGDVWLGVFQIEDTLRPGAPQLVAALEKLGKRVHLLSGDNAAIVERVAQDLGIKRVRAEADPEAKQAYLRALQQDGAVVAMVGDGINDAPVLAQADVSIAMSEGADLAQAQADAVLLSGQLGALASAFDLAVRALGVVRQNLVWAFAYNLVAVPAAALGAVTPWMAGIGMSGSSLAVVLNALRLRSRRQGSGAVGSSGGAVQ
jgi:Cu2+-exporting ATPase